MPATVQTRPELPSLHSGSLARSGWFPRRYRGGYTFDVSKRGGGDTTTTTTNNNNNNNNTPLTPSSSSSSSSSPSSAAGGDLVNTDLGLGTPDAYFTYTY
ncbi:hypothetical protein Pmani_033671 [Petrolisthes manimaculis]|uniref:Uncharacterized protein n=1 Tax=Petrolisthes manimaculis TaxID=1843537 RepID=A0AAE1NQX2_9EUCA|nr:hypothetical protein Pmani_033671 [Petrolisthes manimaculis]